MHPGNAADPHQVSQKAYLNGLECSPLIVKNGQEKLLARICRKDRQVADSTFSRKGIFAEARFSMESARDFPVVFI